MTLILLSLVKANLILKKLKMIWILKKAEKESIEIKSSIKAYHDEEEDKNYGTFEGYGSVFGNKDLGNDVIEAGAFTKSLKRRKPQNVKLLYQHKSDMPIGVFDEIKEDSHGLSC